MKTNRQRRPGYRPPPAGAKIFSLAEIEKHDSEDDAWILVKDKVYDCTAYIASGAHPGGNASIVMNAGTDSTEDFEAVHSAKAWKQLDPFLIGVPGPRGQPRRHDRGRHDRSGVGSRRRREAAAAFYAAAGRRDR